MTKRRRIVSREYKVMLRPARFRGDERRLLTAAAALWRDLARSAADTVLDTDGRLDRVHARRLIRFHDTRRHHLNRAGYVYRERRDQVTGACEATLKFRHPDRYVAEHRDMAATGAKSGRTKFEEDVKVPFVSLYSFSTTLPVDPATKFRTLGDAARLFPDLRKRLEGFGGGRRLAVVKGFTADERVIVGARLQIGKSPPVWAECALIVWHDHARPTATPVAVELSYRYGDKKERYGGMTARRAFDVFRTIQTRLCWWVDPRPVTKTAFVYA
jgi:hypothetical protein